MSAFSAVFRRDLVLSLRHWGELANPMIFLVIVASLFPLSLSPEVSQLRDIGTGVLWVSALLSSLLALEGLFRADADDGSMEQMILAPASLVSIVLGKLAAHWLVSAVPLLLLAPLLALMFYLPLNAIPTLLLALLLATPTLSVLAGIGASLTVSLRAGGAILGLLVLPLTAPVLIFGTRATDLAIHGEPTAAPLYFLASMAVLAVTLGPFAAAAALRVSVE
jgi:heme exporter protein B